jgi:sensor domain CHASE-containing protein
MSTTLQPLPNPFLHSQAGPRPTRPGHFAVQPALVAFLVCLVLGLAAVGWRAKSRADAARARASLEALARGSAVELQFSQLASAAEVLGALARHHGGAIPDFQKVATDLLAARPGLASLELQPGGVVSDIVPRATNARAIGFNVLSNPAYRPGALATVQRRALTVAGPLTLYGGEPGIVARVPVFQRNRDGRDAFWGFVAASMRVSEALNRAQVNDLVRHGYNYAFSTPASGRALGLTIATHGTLSAGDVVQQDVGAQNVRFRLLLQPRGGWVNKTKLVLEVLGVLVASGLVCLLVNLLESRRGTVSRGCKPTARP